MEGVEQQKIMKGTVQSDQNKTSVQSRVSHEPFFGMLVFAALLLFTIVSLAGIGWVMYSEWQASREHSGQLSIATLPKEEQISDEALTDNNQGDPDQNVALQNSEEKPILAPKDVEVKVLNGGAAKGSAGIVTDVLKQAGYAKAIFGNATGDYSGVVVYHKVGLDREATAVKDALIKKYPVVTMKEAGTANTEVSVMPITVVVGK